LHKSHQLGFGCRALLWVHVLIYGWRLCTCAPLHRARHKAERGELRQGLPVGLARGPAGEVILNPDEEVQARIQLVFEKFRSRGLSGWLVMREGLLLLLWLSPCLECP